MLTYWFSLLPPALPSNREALWGGIALLAIIAGFVIRRVVIPRRRDPFSRKPWRRAARLCTTAGILLFVLLFFRSERIAFFGSRFWLLLLVVGGAVWTAAIIRQAKVQVPKNRTAWEAEQQKRKDLK